MGRTFSGMPPIVLLHRGDLPLGFNDLINRFVLDQILLRSAPSESANGLAFFLYHQRNEEVQFLERTSSIAVRYFPGVADASGRYLGRAVLGHACILRSSMTMMALRFRKGFLSRKRFLSVSMSLDGCGSIGKRVMHFWASSFHSGVLRTIL